MKTHFHFLILLVSMAALETTAQISVEILIAHKTFNSGDMTKPYIISNANGEKQIVEP